MTKAQIAATATVVVLVTGVVLLLCSKTGGQAPPPEKADIELHFSPSPVAQVLSIYAGLANEKLRAPANVLSGESVQIITTHKIARTEALKLIETALLEQAQFSIKRGADGTLELLPKQKLDGPPAYRDAVITYFPDGNIDSPFPSGPGPVVKPRLQPVVPSPQR